MNSEILEYTPKANNNQSLEDNTYPELFSPIMEEKAPYQKEIVDKIEDEKYNTSTLNAHNSYFNSSQFSCSCPRIPGVSYACEKAHSWMQVLNKRKDFDIVKMKQLYKNILEFRELNEYEDQIQKDLQRTFPKCSQF